MYTIDLRRSVYLKLKTEDKEVYFLVLLLEPKTGHLGFVTKRTGLTPWKSGIIVGL